MQRRFQTWLLSVFSVLALGLAALGVFAVMHYSVAARTAELGIRMALGADTTHIRRLILASGTRLALAGIVIGLLMATWSNEAIAGMLYKVRPSDPLSLGFAAATLLLIALIASYLPARRAARLDPIAALHCN